MSWTPTDVNTVPVNVKDRDTFHITIEDYLHGLISLIDELVGSALFLCKSSLIIFLGTSLTEFGNARKLSATSPYQQVY